MDRTEITRALKLAQTAVVSHGIIKHIPERYKSTTFLDVGDFTDMLQYEFYLDTKKSVWDANNFTCSLVISYRPENDIEIDGGIYRDYFRKVVIRHGSSDVESSTYKAREDFIVSLLMVAEIVESITPPKIKIMLETPEEVIRRRRREYEQEIGNRIHGVLDKNDFKNLRKGGKARLVRIPDTYTSCYGSLPEQGTYAYRHAARRNRRGSVLEYVNYVFRVHPSSEMGSYVKISKV